MQVIKAIAQNFAPSETLLDVIRVFRMMTNDCIRVGLETGTTSLKSLSLKAYHALDRYETPSAYKLNAISRAAGILRHYRKALKKYQSPTAPYVRKLMLTTCYGVKVKGGYLHLPYGEKIKLNRHTLVVLSDPAITVRSAALTTRNLSVSFSKEIVPIRPTGAIGVDRNLNNVTIADVDGFAEVMDLRRATTIKERYRSCKRALRRKDARIQTRVYGKYGFRQRNRITQLLHLVSKSIIEKASVHRFGIVMEKLTGIRKLYRRGNGQGTDYRARMNSWSYSELQRQIEYKARWEGLPVVYVNAGGTSKKCSICGSNMVPEENRLLTCTSCGLTVDRDVNAARNIAVRGLLRFDSPEGQRSEAMVPERLTANPASQSPEDNPQSYQNRLIVP